MFFTFVFVFCSFTSSVPLFRWIKHDPCCVCFFVYFVSDPFNLDLLVHRNCCFFCIKAISKVRHLITIVLISLEKGTCFDFNYFWSLITNCLVLICRKLLFLQSFTQYFTTKNSTYSIWCGSHNVSIHVLWYIS